MYLLTTCQPFQRFMETAWSPHMLTAPLLKDAGILFLKSCLSSFQPLGYETERILRRVFKEDMHMVGIYCDLDYLYIQFFAGLQIIYTFRDHCYISVSIFPRYFGANTITKYTIFRSIIVSTLILQDC